MKRSLVEERTSSLHPVHYAKEDITRIIPHRPPFLLIDSLHAIDLERRLIVGKRFINPGDPVFKGHFPDYPVYPGVLQIEMIGQLGLCLHHFLRRGAAGIDPIAPVPSVRLVKVTSAVFQHEVFPGDQVDVIVQQLEEDDYLLQWAGQIMRGDTICSAATAELFLV
jgi:3-hydroxymyristoyl/3-hydroxydecanoyl-(acyl carrier protein) dehydratase